MSAATEKLDMMYESLPRIACQGKCQKSCGPIQMSCSEKYRLTKKLGFEPRWPDPLKALTMALAGLDDKLTCPLLDEQTGRCTVYAIRPLICRLFGLVKMMACPWGCVPERWLTDAEARELLVAAERIEVEK